MIHTSHEKKRGCGFRKGGGTYIVSAAGPGSMRPCGKLPIPLGICPTCNQGIKQTRGWTWIDALKLLGEVECKGVPGQPCETCSLCYAHLVENPKMGLLWIGEAFYKTPNDFMGEGMMQGISRRLTAVPRGFEVGKHWVVLAHPKVPGAASCEECSGTGVVGYDNEDCPEESAVPCPVCNGSGKIPGPAIFTCFKPTAIEYVVKGDETEEELDKLEARGIRLVDVKPIEPCDECGGEGEHYPGCSRKEVTLD